MDDRKSGRVLRVGERGRLSGQVMGRKKTNWERCTLPPLQLCCCISRRVCDFSVSRAFWTMIQLYSRRKNIVYWWWFRELIVFCFSALERVVVFDDCALICNDWLLRRRFWASPIAPTCPPPIFGRLICPTHSRDRRGLPLATPGRRCC